MGIVLREVLTPYESLAPVFHLVTIVFVILLWRFNLKIARYFARAQILHLQPDSFYGSFTDFQLPLSKYDMFIC